MGPNLSHRPEGNGNPVARSSHSLAYDIARGVVVLFAGTDNAERLSDTWEYDGLSWKEIVPADPEGDGNPVGRSYHSLAYDIARGVVGFVWDLMVDAFLTLGNTMD